MKNLLTIQLILLLSLFGGCQKSEENNPIEIPDNVELNGITDSFFGTKVNQQIKIISENDTINAKVLDIDNTLCPSNPGITCVAAGYLIVIFSVDYKSEKDTVQLRHGIRTSPESWIADKDSVVLPFNNQGFILTLENAEYYSSFPQVEGKEGVYLSMSLKKSH